MGIYDYRRYRPWSEICEIRFSTLNRLSRFKRKINSCGTRGKGVIDHMVNGGSVVMQDLLKEKMCPRLVYCLAWNLKREIAIEKLWSF
jgi:transposase